MTEVENKEEELIIRSTERAEGEDEGRETADRLQPVVIPPKAKDSYSPSFYFSNVFHI
jgi:hypothetical protein